MKIYVYGAESWRPIVHVDDIARAILLIIKNSNALNEKVDGITILKIEKNSSGHHISLEYEQSIDPREDLFKYALKSKYRILPKEFGEYRGKKVFEVERVCIGTNTMSFQSYLKCRNHSFIVKVLSQQIFSPIQILAKKFGISWYELTKEVSDIVQHENFSGKFKEVYDAFCDESYTELFHTKEEATTFYSKPENYKSLLQGEIGENLTEKYVGKAILVYEDIITTLFYVIRNKLSKNDNKETDLIINSAEKWLKNLYMIEEILDEETSPEKYGQTELKIDFDFPNWLLENHLPFDKFKNKCTYKMIYDIEKLKYFRNTKKSYDKNYNKVRAVGRFVRGHMSRGTSTFEKQFHKIN